MGLFGSSDTPKRKSDDIWFKRLKQKSPKDLPAGIEINPLQLTRQRFIEIAIRELYSRIMFSTVEMVAMPKDMSKSDFAVTVYDRHSPKMIKGLIRHIVDAMADGSSLTLRKTPIPNRKNGYFFKDLVATHNEKPADIVEMDFSEYDRTDVLVEYYGMIFDSIVGAARLIRVGSSIILKIADLSDLISDREILIAVEAQLEQIQQALEEGKTGYMDKNSDIMMPEVKVEPVAAQLKFAYSLICNATGRPMSFVNGEMAASLGSTGEGDRKQNRQASIYDFNSILRGILEAVFGADFEIKPDIESLPNLADFMSTIEMSGLLADDEKRRILSQYLSLDDYGISLGTRNIPT